MLPVSTSDCPGLEPITIPMTADNWQTKENGESPQQLGFFHGLMRLNSGDAALNGITFSDGWIEFDVNTIGRGAPGIAFRQHDEGNVELLYVMPDPNCPAFRACIQYAPQSHGDTESSYSLTPQITIPEVGLYPHTSTGLAA
jgi:hypothetical protein